MDFTKNIKTIEQAVENVLENFEFARGDDFILYLMVVDQLAPKVRESGKDFYTILLNHRDYDLPIFESVTRARRTIQRLRPLLLPEHKIYKMRVEKEEQLREYHRNN